MIDLIAKARTDILIFVGYASGLVAFALQVDKARRATREKQKLAYEVEKLEIEISELKKNAEYQRLKLKLEIEKLQTDTVRQEKADAIAERRIRIADRVEMMETLSLVTAQEESLRDKWVESPNSTGRSVRPGYMFLFALLSASIVIFGVSIDTRQRAELHPAAPANEPLRTFDCEFYVPYLPEPLECDVFHLPPEKYSTPEEFYAPWMPLRY